MALADGLLVDDVGCSRDELQPLQGRFVDGSPVSEYVLSKYGRESQVHVVGFADSDRDAVSEYGCSQGVSEADHCVFEITLEVPAMPLTVAGRLRL